MKDFGDEFQDAEHMHNELLHLRKRLADEMSKNAFVSVTGKSLNEIRADGIFEMLHTFQDNNQAITAESIEDYASSLTN